jgi:Rps23 Pro-64 3,4-dihydroxylase Tpa1-like proline 4-hydroxylase
MGNGWIFGHGSGAGGIAFWKMHLEGVEAVDQLWEQSREQCEKLVGKPLKVIRQYANGHTYGQGGQPHQDDVRPDCYTFLYYPMLKWQGTWDGETVYYQDDGEIRFALKPKPNRAIFFDSTILHQGRAPSRYFSGLRVTIAFKLELA